MSTQFSHFETRLRHIAELSPCIPIKNVTLTRLIFYVFKALEINANNFLAEFGLNNNHFIALMMIYASKDNMLNPCMLSEALLSSRANITRLMDELVDNGWVERKASTEDRRRIELSLTPVGTTLIERVQPQNWQRINSIWAEFSEPETELVEQLLRKLLARISQDEGENNACES
jgi:MarR family transcriptional repressor of emrRAB